MQVAYGILIHLAVTVGVIITYTDERRGVCGAEGQDGHLGGGGGADGLDEQLAALDGDAAAHIDEVLDRDHQVTSYPEFDRIGHAVEFGSFDRCVCGGQAFPMHLAAVRADVVQELKIRDREDEAFGQARDTHFRDEGRHAYPAAQLTACLADDGEVKADSAGVEAHRAVVFQVFDEVDNIPGDLVTLDNPVHTDE